MIIGILQIELFLPDNQSLKEKRMVLNSLKNRLHNEFNIGVSELDHHDKWQRTLLGIVSIGNERRAIESMLSKIVESTKSIRTVEVVDYSTEIL